MRSENNTTSFDPNDPDKGTSAGTVNEDTRYVYGCPYDGSLQTAVVYPDSTDSVHQDANADWVIDSGSDHTSATYNWLGQTLTATDQRGVEHKYTYDSADRLAEDFVASLGQAGQNVNGTVRAIRTYYDDLGRVRLVQNWGWSDAGQTLFGPLNEVIDTFDGWGNLSQESQADVAAFPLGGVSYSYSDGAPPSGANQGVAQYVRLQSVTYTSPDSTAREIDYNYGGDQTSQQAINAVMSRLSSISDSGGTLATETYLGLSDIVTESYTDPQDPGATPQISLDYTQGGSYAGLDRFGRVLEQLWSQVGQSNPLDEYQYTYDPVGNENRART